MKKFEPKCAWIKKEQAAQRRALNRKTFAEIRNGQEPVWRAACAIPSRFGRKTTIAFNEELTALYLYAAEMGRKWGQLPQNCSQFSVTGFPNSNGTAAIAFQKPSEKPIIVTLRNLNWIPAEPIEETTPEWSEPMKEAA